MQKKLEEEDSQVINEREQLKKTIKNIMDEFEEGQLGSNNNKSQFEDLVNQEDKSNDRVVADLNVSEIIDDKQEQAANEE